MLKKILKPIRKQLLKLDWVKQYVADYRKRLEEERYQERWAQRMSTGYTIRNIKPLKLEPHDTLAIITDDGLIVEYMDGRMVGQRPVTMNLIRPFGTKGLVRDSKDCSNNDTNNRSNNDLPDGCYSPDGGWYANTGPCTTEQSSD